MRISGIDIEIDVLDYLQRKGLSRIRMNGRNAMACCPFHDDRDPSFGVNIDTGEYNCFGCGVKGPFASLVKRLDRFDTVFDAEQYLIGVYGRYNTVVDEPLELTFSDKTSHQDDYSIDDGILRNYRFRHPYLSNRGVKELWKNVFEIGYNENTRSITFPYRDERGRLITIKHRKIVGKSFWYDPPLPSRIKAKTLYALDKTIKAGVSKVALTEAEIDCITVWQAVYQTHGIGAVAIGGNQFTDEQADALIRWLPPQTELIVFTDNDKGGAHAKTLIADKLMGRFTLTSVDWSIAPGTPKDANDVSEQVILDLIRHRTPVSLDFG